MSVKTITLLLSGIFNLSIALFILYKKQRSIPHRAIAITALMASLWSISNSFFVNIPFLVSFYNEMLYYAFETVANLTAMSGITALWIFSITFPDYRPRMLKLVLSVTLGAYALLCALVLWPHLFVTRITFSPDFQSFNIATTPLYAFYALYILSLLIAMIISFYEKVTHSQGLVRVQLKIIVAGGIITVVTGIVFSLLLPQAFHDYSFTWIGASSPVIFISFITYAIVKYRFVDMRFLANKIVQLSIFFIVIIASFYLVSSLEMRIFGSIYTLSSFILNIILGYVYGVIFLFLGDELASRELIRGRYSSAALQRDITAIINNELSLSDLVPKFASALKDALSIESAALLLVDAASKSVKETFSYDLTVNMSEVGQIIQKIPLTKPVYVKDELTNIAFSDKERADLEAIAQLLEKNRVALMLPMLYDKSLIALLLLGKQKKASSYSLQEISLLVTLTSQLAVAISRSLLYDDVVRFNLTLKEKIHTATKEIQEAYEKEKETAREERDMLDIMGHELRTPATIVKLAAYMLKGKITDEEEKRDIGRIIESIERQIKLINTFISAAKLDNGKMDLALSPVRLDEALRQAVEDHESEAKEKSLSLECEEGIDAPYVLADSARIREVIDNLITNAIKYTQEGSIKVKAFASGREVIVSVEDTGEGIRKEDQIELFKKFKRINNYTSTSKGDNAQMVRPGGTGLGLYVSKGIVEMHKGRIWIESEIGKGSTFSFALPIASEEDIRKLPAQERPAANMFKRSALTGGDNGESLRS